MVSAIIMAGGGGTRFWPKSRKNFPKQCIAITGMNSLGEETVERIKGFIPRKDVYISTGRHLFETMRGFPLLKGAHYVIEPYARDTAAAIGLSAAKINSEKKDEVLVILPADAYIREPEEYIRYLETAADIARADDKIVLLGIKPTRAATGYGYIQKGKQIEKSWVDVSSVNAFREKPDEKTAEGYLRSGEYLWNAGMFITKASVILEEIRKHMPELNSALERIVEHDFDEAVTRDEFERLERISIDFGVMEKAYNRLAVVTGDFYWDDVGDWAAMERVCELDENNNAVDADVEGDNRNCVIYGDGKLIEMNGMDSLIVVDTKDALLVAKKERAQDVKKVVEVLEKDERLKGYAEGFVEKPEKHYINIDSKNVYAKMNKLLAVIGIEDMKIEETDERIVIKNG